MLKYYVALLLIAGGVLLYVFLQDPCGNQVRVEFSGRYPDYEVLSSDATEGTPDRVHCRIYYRKPGDEQVLADTWLYRNSSAGWRFIEILASGEVQTPR